jgi:hypothetical protein
VVAVGQRDMIRFVIKDPRPPRRRPELVVLAALNLVLAASLAVGSGVAGWTIGWWLAAANLLSAAMSLVRAGLAEHRVKQLARDAAHMNADSPYDA